MRYGIFDHSRPRWILPVVEGDPDIVTLASGSVKKPWDSPPRLPQVNGHKSRQNDRRAMRYRI